jgi:hypothetical protein
MPTNRGRSYALPGKVNWPAGGIYGKTAANNKLLLLAITNESKIAIIALIFLKGLKSITFFSLE